MSTKIYAKRATVGRLKVGYAVFVHSYHAGDKRYVIRPEVIWDTKVKV